jgi:hypothetical protein
MYSVQDVAENVQTTLNYNFTGGQLILDALRAAGAGFSTQHARAAKDGNKRLARLGNLALQMVIADMWYDLDEERGSHTFYTLVVPDIS